MAKNSNIEWTHHTFNPWVGCTKISPACDNCYAEAWDKRYGGAHWGAKAPRRRTTQQNWKQPLKWNAEAAAAGERHRVFCASLADVFDNKAPQEWRNDLFDLIRATPHLDWLLLTKRPQNIAKMLPKDWGAGWSNIWLGTTVENQTEAQKRIPALLAVPAKLHFLSCEPLLSALDLTILDADDGEITPLTSVPWSMIVDHWRDTSDNWKDEFCDWYGLESVPTTGIAQPALGWIICGGESGSNARPMHPDWARSLRDQCAAAGVPFFFKQWGAWAPGECCQPQTKTEEGAWWWNDQWCSTPVTLREAEEMHRENEPDLWRVGKKKTSAYLDGKQHLAVPTFGETK